MLTSLKRLCCHPLIRRFSSPLGESISHPVPRRWNAGRGRGGLFGVLSNAPEKSSSGTTAPKRSQTDSKSEHREKPEVVDDIRKDAEMIKTTEVSTRTGVIWLDVSGRTNAWNDDSFHREGDFLTYAVTKLHNVNIPQGMISKATHNSRPMPSVHVEETWACLTLRCARENPRWLSSVLHGKVRDFRNVEHDDRQRSRLHSTHNDLDGDGVYDEEEFVNEDELRVRRGRMQALDGEGREKFLTSHLTMIDLTDRMNIFIFKEPPPMKREKELCEDDSKPARECHTEVEDGFQVQWRIVTIHRYQVPFVHEMLRSWGMSDRLRHETFIGLIRRFVHGATSGVQSADYRSAEKLDDLETLLFNSSTKMHELSKILTQVHKIQRRASIHANLLRETHRSYVKVLKTLQFSTLMEDQRELMYLTNALSLAEELQEQSRSLLLLQFSVAAYTLEDHLRTLTIFTTLFVPLELITSWFGVNFTSLHDFMENPWSVIFAGALLVVTGFFTNGWMRRHVISTR